MAHKLILAGGEEISSGYQKTLSLQRVSLSQWVNTQEALTCGSVCADCLEVSLLSQQEHIPISPGDSMELWKDGEKIGVFYCEKLEKTGKGQYTLTAYDSLRQLDQVIDPFLSTLSHWPYTLRELAELVCAQCSLRLQEGQLPQEERLVQAFSGKDITGRMVLSWIGQVMGRFCRVDSNGQVAFSWYAPMDLTLAPGTENWYYRGSFTREGEISPIDQVQLRWDSTDVGVSYPSAKKCENVYVVEGNPLLQGMDKENLSAIAQSLYTQLRPISYTAGQVKIPSYLEIPVGKILRITDEMGQTHTFYGMGRQRQGSRDTLFCKGVENRQKAQVASRQEYAALSGKLFHLQMDVEGLQLENREKEEAITALNLDTQGIRTQVLQQQEEMGSVKSQVSKLTQDSGKLELRLSQMEENGSGKITTSTGYRFDSEGLYISKSGEEMENKLDNTGMYVRRSGQVILQANNRGVEATDVTVHNYLTVGGFSRLEEYSDGTDSQRTACFWIGG